MPYIRKARRAAIAKLWDATPDSANSDTFPQTAGELNYLLTRVIHAYFKERGADYQAINDIVGALDGCKTEFQRRVVAPYEDAKIKANGDVYE